MTDNEKIHQILEYIHTNYDHGIVDTNKIADELNIALSKVNILARKIIQNGDAELGKTDKTTSSNGAISIRQTPFTNAAYEEEKYLNKSKKNRDKTSISADNLHIGDNYGNYSQSKPRQHDQSNLWKWLISIIIATIGVAATIYGVL